MSHRGIFNNGGDGFFKSNASEVTVTSLHPLRLCRIAVFSLKPTFLSNPSTLVGLGSPPPGGEGLKPGGLVSSNKFPCHTNRSSFFNFPIAQDRSHGIGGCGAPDQHQHRRTPTPDQETVAKFVCMSAFLLLVVTPYPSLNISLKFAGRNYLRLLPNMLDLACFGFR